MSMVNTICVLAVVFPWLVRDDSYDLLVPFMRGASVVAGVVFLIAQLWG